MSTSEDRDLKAALELHAALNGLRRGRREPSHGHERALEMVRQKAASKQAQQHQAEHSHSSQKKRAEEDVPREAKRVKTEAHDTGGKGPMAAQPTPVAAVKPEQQQQQTKQPQPQERQQPKKKPAEGRKQRQKEGSQREVSEKGPSPAASLQPEQPATPPVTALEEAAHAASAATQARVKQQHEQQPLQGEDGTARRIKCFMAGIRWGINLAPERLKTRSDLATALNDALAGEILSCGRGDMLSVTMLDRDGNTLEFPSSKPGVQECSNRWKTCILNSSRIYVMRGSY